MRNVTRERASMTYNKKAMNKKTSDIHILVVEDDQALNYAYKIILEHAGYMVDVALNGQDALTVIDALPRDPDIILLDLRMPVLDGIGFLKEFIPEEHPECTVVVFTNYDTHKDIDEAYALGVGRYVLKARTAPNDLLHIVESIISEKVTV